VKKEDIVGAAAGGQNKKLAEKRKGKKKKLSFVKKQGGGDSSSDETEEYSGTIPLSIRTPSRKLLKRSQSENQDTFPNLDDDEGLPDIFHIGEKSTGEKIAKFSLKGNDSDSEAEISSQQISKKIPRSKSNPLIKPLIFKRNFSEQEEKDEDANAANLNT
jgi:hypothetical protein